MITKEIRIKCQKIFGKGNYQLRWNHGGYSLYTKCIDSYTGENFFYMTAYDAIPYINTL